jgi:hypothetical protein
MLSYDLRLRQLYNHVNRYRYFTLRLVPTSMLISINITSTRLIKRTEDADKAKDKALGQTKEIVKGIIKKDTREVIKKIKYSNRKSAMSIISQATD